MKKISQNRIYRKKIVCRICMQDSVEYKIFYKDDIEYKEEKKEILYVA